MKIPRHLNHKPIIAVDNYDKIDAKYANKSDAKYLSIGQAQYDASEISLKVFRHSGEKWKRGSEELPMHRVFDLSILAIASFITDETSNFSISSLREEIVEKNRVAEIKDYYQKNEKMIRPRLKELQKVLDMFFEKENEK